MTSRPVTTLPRTVPPGQARRSLEAVQRFRLHVVTGALLVLFLGLLGRLGGLQLVQASSWSAEAARRHHRQLAFHGMRGRILDAHGRTLVASRRVLSVAVDPQAVEEPREFAQRLATLVDAPADAARIEKAIREAPPTSRHRDLYTSIEDERLVVQLAELRDFAASLRAGLKGLKVEEREQRSYPSEHYAAFVLGRAHYDASGAAAGGHGMEYAFDAELRGEEVRVPVQRDGGVRRQIRAALAVDASRTAGQDLVLTLDIVVQHFVETALDEMMATWKPVFAVGIVMDPQSGEVLALGVRPGFHPAREASRYNHAVQGRYPPGSLFKPFTAAYALGLGVVHEGERLELPLRKPFSWSGHTRWVRDAHPTADEDGGGDLVRLLGHSSNTGASELLWRVMAYGSPPEGEARRSVEPVRKMTARMGFDRPTGIELLGDLPARFDDSAGGWNPLYPTLGFAFGQGFDVSPLRLLSCFAAFARDDARIVRPTLLPGRGGPRTDLPPVCATREHLEVIRQGLANCVDEGTGRTAFAGCRYRVSGKTGTAELPGTSWNFSSFLGYAPRERPQVLVLLLAQVDDQVVHPVTGLRPFGGAVSAPGVRYVIEQTLDYRSSRSPDPSADPIPEEAR